MRFKILGKGSGMPELGKKHSCIYINQDKYNYLIDCGEGTSQAFLENNFDPNLIDFIVISHFHPDHISGIYMLIQMLYLKKRTKTLYLYLPENLDFFLKSLDMFYLFSKRMSYQVEINNITALNTFYPKIFANKNDHLKGYKSFVEQNQLNNELISYSIKIEEQNEFFVYTSDISSTASVMDFIMNSNICIVDAMHPSINELQELKHVIKNQIILTHCQEELFKDLIHREKKFELADDKKFYNFN